MKQDIIQKILWKRYYTVKEANGMCIIPRYLRQVKGAFFIQLYRERHNEKLTINTQS